MLVDGFPIGHTRKQTRSLADDISVPCFHPSSDVQFNSAEKRKKYATGEVWHMDAAKSIDKISFVTVWRENMMPRRPRPQESKLPSRFGMSLAFGVRPETICVCNYPGT